MRHLVVGAGEVGTALHAVLSRAHEVAIRDVQPTDVQAEVLHIAFPWSSAFTASVLHAVAVHGAELVVVHSTVPVGTCDPQRWVYSPVRGRHPRLVAGLEAFVKHFGGPDAPAAARAFAACGVRVQLHDRAAEAEAGKCWELAGYGLAIALEKAIHAWCRQHAIDFDAVYRQFGATYNDGWVALGHPEYVKPVLQHVPGPIGGHCVLPGTAMLDHPLAAAVLDASQQAEADLS